MPLAKPNIIITGTIMSHVPSIEELNIKQMKPNPARHIPPTFITNCLPNLLAIIADGNAINAPVKTIKADRNPTYVSPRLLESDTTVPKI